MNREELKEKIKSLSGEIKILRATRKECLYGLSDKSYEARHHHVAASLLRGRKIEEIEIPSINNPLDRRYVDQIMQMVLDNEIVCNSEK